MMYLYPDKVDIAALGDGEIVFDQKPPWGIGGIDPRIHASAENGERDITIAADSIGQIAQDLLASLPEDRRSFNIESLTPGNWWIV